MKRSSVALAVVASMAAVVVAACAGPSIPVRTVTITPPSPVTISGRVVVTRLVDGRPRVLRDGRAPRSQLRYSLLAIGAGGFFVNGSRTEGASFSAGDHIHVEGSSDAASAMEQYARALLGGEPLDKRVSLRQLDTRALGISEGVVVVPVLDQLDVSSMSSNNSMSGASSYESGRRSNGDGTDTVTTTTTAGAASSSGGSQEYANARMRLIIIALVGGEATSRRVVYGRGAGATLDEAIAEMGAGLMLGLAALHPAAAPSPAVPVAAPGASLPAQVTAPVTAPPPSGEPPTAPAPPDETQVPTPVPAPPVNPNPTPPTTSGGPP